MQRQRCRIGAIFLLISCLRRVRRLVCLAFAFVCLVPFNIHRAIGELQLPGDLGSYSVGHRKINADEDELLRNPLYVWYPVEPDETRDAKRTQYTLNSLPFPSSHAFDDVPIAGDQPFPLIVYFHGAGAWGAQQPTMAETLASYGFVVAGLTNYGRASSVVDLMEEISSRSDHVLHKRIDTTNVGAVGLSAGASTALTGLVDERVNAAMLIAGSSSIRNNTEPVFVLGGTLDTTFDVSSIESAFARRTGGDRYLAVIEGAGHVSFADWCNRIEYADEHYGPDNIPGFREWAPHACTDEHIPNAEAVDLTNFYAASFFGRHLLGTDSYDELLTEEYVIENEFPVQFESVLADDRPGDANRDGLFNSADMVQVFQEGLYNDRRQVATWRDGDWSGDARFRPNDLTLAFEEGWYEESSSLGASSVPEPSSLVLVTLAVAGLTKRRRSRFALQTGCKNAVLSM